VSDPFADRRLTDEELQLLVAHDYEVERTQCGRVRRIKPPCCGQWLRRRDNVVRELAFLRARPEDARYLAALARLGVSNNHASAARKGALQAFNATPEGARYAPDASRAAGRELRRLLQERRRAPLVELVDADRGGADQEAGDRGLVPRAALDEGAEPGAEHAEEEGRAGAPRG
jgi:hypothetical protein